MAPVLLSVALAEVAADRIDFPALRLQAELSDLHYLYATPAERQAFIKRVKGNATITPGPVLFSTALLAPNNFRLYAHIRDCYTFWGTTGAAN